MTNEENLIPSKPITQIHEFECINCGSVNRYMKPEELIDYKKEYKQLKFRNNTMIHEINELMAYSERNYGINPQKDSLIDKLVKIRDKYT